MTSTHTKRLNVFRKNGTLLGGTTLGNFLGDSGAFDPWVVYDPYINRFWVMAVVGRDGSRSEIRIALSDSSDATDSWTVWTLDARLDAKTLTNNWCDYPKLGFDSQAIYVTCNMFASGGGFTYSKIRIMTKDQFVNGATSPKWWDFWNLKEGNVSTNPAAFTMQPAQMFGASSSDGMYIVNARGGGGTSSGLDVYKFTNPQNCCNGGTTGPTGSYVGVNTSGYGPAAGGRQDGTTTRIHTGDTRLLYATWRGGKLSTGQTVACGTNGADACVAFKEANVSSFPTVSMLNDWVYGKAGADYYYPSAASNSADNKAMVFSRSSASEFVATGYVGVPRSSTCTLCVDSPDTILQSGKNSYVRLDGKSRNRWGDYSGASPDPDGIGVWVAGEFAEATQNVWGVQVGLAYGTVDTVAPETTIVSGPSGTTNNKSASFSFSSSEGGSTFGCKLTKQGGSPATFDPCTSPKAYANLVDGNYTFEVRATDKAGNTDGSPASRSWTVDATAPGAPSITSPADNSSDTDGNVTLSGTAEVNSRVEVFEGTASRGTTTADASGNWSKALNGVPDGSHTFTATAKDAAGNTSGASNPRTGLPPVRRTL